MDWELLQLLVGLTILGLIIGSPAIVVSLTFGFIVARFTRDPGRAAIMSGFVGLLSLWALLGITLATLVPHYGWGGFVIAWAGMLVGLLALPVTIAVSLMVWRFKAKQVAAQVNNRL